MEITKVMLETATALYDETGDLKFFPPPKEATMLRRLRWLSVIALLLLVTITMTACGGSKTGNKQTWPEPPAGSGQV